MSNFQVLYPRIWKLELGSYIDPLQLIIANENHGNQDVSIGDLRKGMKGERGSSY